MIYGSTLFPHAEAAENGMDQFIIHGIARDFPHRFPGFREIDDDEVRLKTLTDGRSRAEDIVQRLPYQFHMAKVGQEEDTARVGILYLLMLLFHSTTLMLQSLRMRFQTRQRL